MQPLPCPPKKLRSIKFALPKQFIARGHPATLDPGTEHVVDDHDGHATAPGL